MSCDTYCVACGISFGEKSITNNPRSTAFRKHFVEEHQEDDQEDCLFCDGTYDEDDENGNELGSGYDCEIIQEDDVSWTESVQVLGFNEQASSIEKAFLSGKGHCDDYCVAEVERGEHKNSPANRVTFACYQTFEDEEKSAFPFHPECYDLLQRVGCGALQLDLLYDVFINQSSRYQSFENISYGNPAPEREQFLLCRPGEEVRSYPGWRTLLTKRVQYMVVNPSSLSQQNAVFERVMQQIRTRQKRWPDWSGKRFVKDPFADLPNEVLHEIMSVLPTGSISALMTASWLFNASFTSSAFWQNQIRARLPWFWELHEFIRCRALSAFETKHLFLWALQATKPQRWMNGSLMVVANRRRIWTACEQIIDLYHQQEDRIICRGSPSPAAQDVLAHAEVLQMPYICYFKDHDDAETVTTIWLHDIVQLNTNTFILETIWEQKSLIGIAVSNDGERNLFGRDHSTSSIVDVEKVNLNGRDWIKGLVLYTQDPSLFGDDTYSCIEGLDIVLNSGTTISHGSAANSESESCKRALYVSSGKYLVGIKGVLARNRILQVGLAQSSFPLSPFLESTSDFATSSSGQTPPTTPESQKCLWRSTLEHDLGDKLFNLSNLRLTEIMEEGVRYRSTVPDSLVPRHPLLFASNIADLRSLTKLWALVTPADFYGNVDDSTDGLTIRRVAGMCMERTVEDEVTITYAGYDANTRPDFHQICSSPSSGVSHDKDEIQTFEVDSPGGERINEVAVCRKHDAIQAIRFRSNWQREAIFGDEKGPHHLWTTAEAPHGETLVGLSLGFGIIGWDADVSPELSKVKRLVSRVGILTLKDR